MVSLLKKLPSVRVGPSTVGIKDVVQSTQKQLGQRTEEIVLLLFNNGSLIWFSYWILQSCIFCSALRSVVERSQVESTIYCI